MKIAFVSVRDPEDPHTWSGIPHAIITHLRRAGAEVEIIGPLSRKARYLFLPTWVGSKLIHKTYHPDREPFLTGSYARQIEARMRGRRFDAILSLETFQIARVNRPEPITYWTDAVWEMQGQYWYHNPVSSLHRKARLHEQRAMEKAAHAIYSSKWAADGVCQYYAVDRNKLAVIPFGPNLEIHHTRADVEGWIAERSRETCTLLFLGVDWQRKGGDIALEAARLLNLRGLKTQLLVTGCSVPGEKPEFVTELGFISKRTPEGRACLTELLRSSHFLFLPTRAECAGIVFCEASAFGLPIITTDTGGVPTYVRQNGNGVRLPLSAGAEAYAETIERLFRDRQKYEAMALEAWEEYASRLNWESSVSSLLSLLKQK